jgi:hypothetical protein
MGWVLRLVETGVEGLGRSVDVMAIECSGQRVARMGGMA